MDIQKWEEKKKEEEAKKKKKKKMKVDSFGLRRKALKIRNLKK